MPVDSGRQGISFVGAIGAAIAAELSLAAPPPPVETNAAPQPTSDDLGDEGEPSQSQRFMMRMIDAPLEADTPVAPVWQGAALVVGENAAADALRRRLAALVRTSGRWTSRTILTRR